MDDAFVIELVLQMKCEMNKKQIGSLELLYRELLIVMLVEFWLNARLL